MENTIFFGNGFNRCSENSKSWNDILEYITNKRKIITDIPNTFQYEDIYLSEKFDIETFKDKYKDKSEEWMIKKNISDEIQKIKPNDLHSILAETEATHYITTNYDYLLEDELSKQGFKLNKEVSDSSEKIYSIRRKNVFVSNEDKKTIWHIHGDINLPQSIMLGYDHYCGSIGKTTSYVKGSYKVSYNNRKIESIINRINNKDNETISWIDLMFMSNVHIVAFGMDYAEQDVWWLLNKRLRFIKEEKAKICNKIFYYCTEDDNKREILESFGVEVKPYPTPTKNNEWISFYKTILNDISDNMKNNSK
ncbi:MAG: SIR2 family protein [Prevotella sp.]|nr:SIR2 family protein [Prevotella sp.]